MYSNKELPKFKDYLENHVSPNTVKVYMYALEQWFKVLNGNKPSQEFAQAHVDTLMKAGKSASTVNLRGHAIMRYFKWKGKPISLDCPTIRMGEPDYLTIDQIEKLLAAANTILEETLITVLFDTAVRISELLNLELDDIDWARGFISVVRKGGRKEDVNISEKALAVLDTWIEVRESESKRVFMDLTYYDAWSTLRIVGKRAGIHLRPHLLRHSRAIFMLMNEATLHDVQMHLGHRNINTTASIYGRFKAIDLKERIPQW